MLGGTSGEYGKSVAGKLGDHHADPPGIHKLKLAGYRLTVRPEAVWCFLGIPPPALQGIQSVHMYEMYILRGGPRINSKQVAGRGCYEQEAPLT